VHKMQKIKIILLKNSYNKQRNYTWCSYQKLFLSFRTTTGELYMQECQTIWSSIVVNCTFDTSWLYFFFGARWLPAVAWRNLAVCIADSFIIPLRCLKLATSPSDLSNSNSVLSMPPVLEATMYDTGFLVKPTSKSRTVLTCCLSLLTSIAQMHKWGLLTSYDCDG